MKDKKEILSDGELNPGLPRDRRGYLPLYYLRFTKKSCKILKAWPVNANAKQHLYFIYFAFLENENSNPNQR